jgi:hydrogenase nickel incorporation protein HypA/HybF
MHELSIAMSLVEVAVEELERQGGGRIETVHVKVGTLSGVVKEALLSAYELACEQSPLAGSRLLIQDVPIEVFCPHCRCGREVESMQDIRCWVCGTRSAQVVRGRELELVALEITDEPTAAIG